MSRAGSPDPRFLAPEQFAGDRRALESEWTLEDSLAYCRWLATSHYENFHVVSFLLPKSLHQDFFNIYSFCRWADDLGDETGGGETSLRLLGWWRGELEAMYAGRVKHPVFTALNGTVRRHDIPREPFSDLIGAFIQDQTVTRYANFEELYGYCRGSANPVGRLVLYLCGYRDAGRQTLSDHTCTALQLANFWQDVTVDLGKDRVYIPLDVMRRHGYTVAELFGRRYNPAFQKVMEEIVGVAHDLFRKGLPLSRTLNRRLAVDIELFSQGGMKILQKIAARNYDVLASRPVITKTERAALLLKTIFRVVSRAA